MAQVLQAGWWGLVAGSALLVGAALGYGLRIPQKVIATVMAFGAGVLLSAVSFELVGEAYDQAGLAPAAVGTLAGAVAYTAGNMWLARRGARHRKRSGHRREQAQPSESGQAGSGLALAFGALLDGVPESAVIGVSLLDGGAVSLVTVAAVFISNVPEGMSSSAGMKKAGRGKAYVFGVWAAIAAASTLAAVLGYTVVGDFSPAVIAAVTAVAAGAILAMIADTMIPEAFEDAHLAIGLVTVSGFLVSFALSHG
ncbi:ZIP family zinc transporter [Streptomyces caelestis]|uniref:ZIP family zinc transporter n=2 Tax=Streptomyces TaxID=1883 RepID=A0A0M8QLB0_9ACTN|nr:MULTISPECIES: ZIP family zinc transporter [Streptomyces]KOT42759.1 ZIP family zinc transporter [Streptomyces caelestis]KOV30052.1 ZIP family zinc transporter [Streptomyces sp. XY152]